MRLPGTRYQEHGWEHVRKLLGQCSLEAFAHCSPAQMIDPDHADATLMLYVELVGAALHARAGSTRAGAPGNSYGESVLELALSLLYELQARPADWAALCAAVANEHEKCGPFWEHAGADAMLRKKVNDMYAVLRDKVDSDNYQVACGRSCSPNKMYTYRMLDMAYAEVARLFEAWRAYPEQVAAILGREINAIPIEARQLKTIGHCKAEWLIRWSETREQFGDGAGPLHTRSKRFSSLKNSPEKISEMLREMNDYEELSANRDQDWLHDADEAANWLDELARVLGEAGGADQDTENENNNENITVSVSPRLPDTSRLTQLAGQSLPVRLAVYLKILGSEDEAYPDQWLDPVTGALPTMEQLAAQDGVSLPTLRKRRDAAIAQLRQQGES